MKPGIIVLPIIIAGVPTNLKSFTILGAEWGINQEDIDAGSSKTLRNLSKSETISINCEAGLFCLIY